MDEYAARFGGIARLYGEQAAKRLSMAHVVVVGIGGVGSWTAEALARTGIGELTLVDLDELCLTNTNRQIHATANTTGQSKVGVMADRLRQINPGLTIHEVNAFFSAPFDAVVDAIDVVRPKVLLLAACRERNIPVVCSGGAGGRRDPFRIQHADLARTHGDALLVQVRKRLRSEHGFPGGDSNPKPFGIPAVFSPESPCFPQCDGEVSEERPEDLPAGLRCDAGFGTATHLTGTFGFLAAHLAIEQVLAGKDA